MAFLMLDGANLAFQAEREEATLESLSVKEEEMEELTEEEGCLQTLLIL